MRQNEWYVRTIGRLCAAIVAVTLLLGAAAGTALAKEKVTIGAAVTWPGYGFWYIIEEKGLAPELDLEVNILDEPLTGHSMLAAGQLDVYNSTPEYLPIAVEQGLPIKNVAMTSLSRTERVILAPGIEVEDLPGKKVAAPQAFIGDLVMRFWLGHQGIDVNDVEWVNLAADEAASAMLGGDIAAAYLYEPWDSEVLEHLEGSRVVARSSDPMFLETAMLGDSIFVSGSFLSNRREVALRLLRAYWDAVDWWKANPAEGNDIITEHIQWSLADTESILGKDGSTTDMPGGMYVYSYIESARFCGVAPGDPPFGEKFGQFYQAFHLTNEIWKGSGLMESIVPAARGIDCGLMRELYETGYAGEPEPNY